ncbi:hypothetical protein DSECCO2_500720 [anaerobic digester metagenome]
MALEVVFRPQKKFEKVLDRTGPGQIDHGRACCPLRVDEPDQCIVQVKEDGPYLPLCPHRKISSLQQDVTMQGYHTFMTRGGSPYGIDRCDVPSSS